MENLLPLPFHRTKQHQAESRWLADPRARWAVQYDVTGVGGCEVMTSHPGGGVGVCRRSAPGGSSVGRQRQPEVHRAQVRPAAIHPSADMDGPLKKLMTEPEESDASSDTLSPETHSIRKQVSTQHSTPETHSIRKLCTPSANRSALSIDNRFTHRQVSRQQSVQRSTSLTNVVRT